MPIELSLTGKVAIVTGSGKENGIGAGIALALARAGARVCLNHVSDATAPRAKTVVTSIEAIAGPGAAIVVQADISTPAGAKALVEATLKSFQVDHVDVLVNNAAWATMSRALDIGPDDLLKTYAVSVFAPLYMIQSVVPHMPRGGRIVNVGSIAAKLGLESVYASAKGALNTLTLCMAKELGVDHGITINTVMPGPVITDALPQEYPPVKELTDRMVSITRAEKRPGTVADVADVVVMLASEQSRWITGQCLSVSGGITGA